MKHIHLLAPLNTLLQAKAMLQIELETHTITTQEAQVPITKQNSIQQHSNLRGLDVRELYAI